MPAADVLATPEPKTKPVPAPTRKDERAELNPVPEPDDRWANMPCTD